MDEYMQKLVKSKEFEIYKNLDKATHKNNVNVPKI